MTIFSCVHVQKNERPVFAGCSLQDGDCVFEMDVCKECVGWLIEAVDKKLGLGALEQGHLHWTRDEAGVMRGNWSSVHVRRVEHADEIRKKAYDLVQEELQRAQISVIHVNCDDQTSYCAFERDGADIPEAENARSLQEAVDAVLRHRDGVTKAGSGASFGESRE